MENSTARDKSIRSAGKVSAGTLASRVLGLVREQVFAYLFGASLAADAFIAAFRVPNLLRDMFAEGALSAAFIPTFTEKLTTDGKPEAFRVARIVFSFLLVVVSAVVVAGMIFAPQVVDQIAGGFSVISGKIDLTASLARIMMPFLLCVSLAALLMGILNSLGIFGVPAFAPMLLNLAMIAAGFLLCPLFDPPIIGMAVGVVLGGVLQFAVQYPSVRKAGFKLGLDFNFRDSAFRKILTLMVPMAIGYSATQINVFVVTRIAASLAQGSVSYLNYAFRLMHLPLGLFALAIATVSLPEISRYAALKDNKRIAESYMNSLKLGLFLVIPASIVLIFGGEAIISVLFQHGHFSYQDTVGASSALAFYSIGLLSFAAIRITVPVFYAFKETGKPIIASLASVTVNIILCYLLKDSLGFRGLALAAALAGFLNLGLLMIMLRFRLPEITFGGEIRAFLKIVIVNGILAVAIMLWSRYLSYDLSQSSLAYRILNLGILLAGAISLYLTFARILHIKELAGLTRIFKRIRG